MTKYYIVILYFALLTFEYRFQCRAWSVQPDVCWSRAILRTRDRGCGSVSCQSQRFYQSLFSLSQLQPIVDVTLLLFQRTESSKFRTAGELFISLQPCRLFANGLDPETFLAKKWENFKCLGKTEIFNKILTVHIYVCKEIWPTLRHFNFLNYNIDEKIFEKLIISAWVFNPKELNILKCLNVGRIFLNNCVPSDFY